MSRSDDDRFDVPENPPAYLPICEFCGLAIPHDHRRCPALDDGRCRP